MQTEIVTATNSLEGFAAVLDSTWTDQPWHTQIGQWNIVPLSRQDWSSRVRRLAERLQSVPSSQMNEEILRKVRNLPDQISWFQSNTLPQLSGGNLPQVVSSFDSILSNVEQSLPVEVLPDWESVAGSNLIPKELGRRLRSLEAAVERLSPRAGDLEEKIQRIDDAHSAALDLPTDMQTLKEARDEVVRYVAMAKQAADEAAASQRSSAESCEGIAAEEDVAKQLIKNIESAYSAATTVGLAGAFSDRARSLNASTWIWVGFLVVTLLVGGFVGAHRLAELQELATARAPANVQWLWLNAAMSMLAIAAPVWFAWLATRQIAQRFRLAEDYAFKASVAKAYEGYRREAARLDPELEARLFASALDRLDEAPLRFLAVEEHGSPYEALLASAGFQKALEKFPSLREAAEAVIDRATANAGRVGVTAREATRGASE